MHRFWRGMENKNDEYGKTGVVGMDKKLEKKQKN
jgi:hypothetical protein